MIILDIVLYIILILIVIGLSYIIYIFVYDYIVYKINNNNTISSTSATIDTNMKKLHSNINSLNDDYSKKISSIKDDYNSIITSNASVLNRNIVYLQNQNIADEKKSASFDSNLKKFFDFGGIVSSAPKDASADVIAAAAIADKQKSLADYTFDTAVTHYNLTLVKNVNAASGMTIKTNPGLTDLNNFRICDNKSSENCVNLNLDANGNFNISPENANVNKLKMYNKSGTSLATFDFGDNSIRLGENNNDTALLIKDNSVYIKNLKLVNSGYTYSAAQITDNDYSTINKDTLTSLSSVINTNNIVQCYYNITTNPTNSIVLTLIPQVTINATAGAPSYIYLNIPEISSSGSGNSISLTETTLTITAAIFVSNYSKSDNTSLSYLKLTVVNKMYAKSKTTVTINSGFSVLSNTNSSSISIGYIDTV